MSSTADRYLVVAREVASDAAQLVMQGYRASVAASEKGRADLVTAYDLASEKLIREQLSARTPEVAIVGEEQGGQLDDAPTWLCDPIDGTTNFVHGLAFFCVSIGLFDQGRPVLGAVVAPALGVTWYGGEGLGAFRQAGGAAAEPCRVSATQTLASSLVGTGFHPQSRGQHPDDNLASFGKVMQAVRDIRRCGSAAIDLCMVADGTFDAYWERRLHPWDLMAGAALVLAAGGRITHIDGGPVDLRKGHLLASNGLVHDELLASL
jgi:myo-inositol-1(or 4)-monophosphatase